MNPVSVRLAISAALTDRARRALLELIPSSWALPSVLSVPLIPDLWRELTVPMGVSVSLDLRTLLSSNFPSAVLNAQAAFSKTQLQ